MISRLLDYHHYIFNVPVFAKSPILKNLLAEERRRSVGLNSHAHTIEGWVEENSTEGSGENKTQVVDIVWSCLSLFVCLVFLITLFYFCSKDSANIAALVGWLPLS